MSGLFVCKQLTGSVHRIRPGTVESDLICKPGFAVRNFLGLHDFARFPLPNFLLDAKPNPVNLNHYAGETGKPLKFKHPDSRFKPKAC